MLWRHSRTCEGAHQGRKIFLQVKIQLFQGQSLSLPSFQDCFLCLSSEGRIDFLDRKPLFGEGKVTEKADEDLVARWRTGDQQAAADLFRRYAERLIALARSRLSTKMARRIDPEDVVQSAYRSFFSDSRADRCDVERGGDLWQLLVTITLHKLHHHVTRASAQKRAVDRERNFGSEDSLLGIQAHLRAQEPSPMEALALSELLEQVMRQLDPRERRMFELRLQGHNLEEIAAATSLSRRTVRRTLAEVKQRLEQWYNRSDRSPLDS
jgi:RNA polymerase sigma-70 factor (ECF subfamily)